jgi:hypothetical protein
MDTDRITVARKRLERAVGLSAVLGAAYDAFEDMLLVLEDLQDPAWGAFAAFMMSGASAASGRDAVVAAAWCRRRQMVPPGWHWSGSL